MLPHEALPAAVVEKAVLARRAEAVGAQELLTIETVVFFNGGEDGGAGQITERHMSGTVYGGGSPMSEYADSRR